MVSQGAGGPGNLCWEQNRSSDLAGSDGSAPAGGRKLRGSGSVPAGGGEVVGPGRRKVAGTKPAPLRSGASGRLLARHPLAGRLWRQNLGCAGGQKQAGRRRWPRRYPLPVRVWLQARYRLSGKKPRGRV